MTKYLLVDDSRAFLLVDAALTLPSALPTGPTIRLSKDVVAMRVHGIAVSELNELGHHIEVSGDARTHAEDPLIARAIALLNAQERMRVHPTDGTPLTWDADGTQAESEQGNVVFPRIDPSVIGIVTSADDQKILMVENVRRPGYFTSVAGYVDPGETIEAAWAREVREETGYTVSSLAYVGSQPWPLSGALMLGFVSRVDETATPGETDGELRRMVWASRQEVMDLPLPPQGSISLKLITRWVDKGFDDVVFNDVVFRDVGGSDF
ncbi:NUDIX domain-containing protein [Corynebacterium sp. HMSC29G08]|uniref:NUDIX domain-containing protein n=1 Tax=Corynebacterium sp. HMSC29G08 TaxID=1581069 RepID=UPI0008A4C217|nr:NUDIX domain-containing protein [Corynebacterium sp. HMSC29G08]OFT82382.1 hypothetical protein HMPREF3101_07540 [Corynebacterium sp. HMSC29G08]